MNFRRHLVLLLIFCLLHMQQAGLWHALAHAHSAEGGAAEGDVTSTFSDAKPLGEIFAADKFRAAHSCLVFDALTLAHCVGVSYFPSFGAALVSVPLSGPGYLAPDLPFLPPFFGRAPPLG